MRNVFLIRTDGFNINVFNFVRQKDARIEMKKQFEEFLSVKKEEYSEEMSYCGENDATLYTGETVYVWKIIMPYIQAVIEEADARGYSNVTETDAERILACMENNETVQECLELIISVLMGTSES